MMWSRLAAGAGGAAMAGSAFLPWFECGVTLRCFGAGSQAYPAIDIPALLLLRYVDRAPGMRLGYLVVMIGLVLISAALMPAPTRGWVALCAGALGLATAVTFVAHLAREVSDVSGAGGGVGLGDVLGLGPVVAAAGSLVGMAAAAGGWSGRPPVGVAVVEAGDEAELAAAAGVAAVAADEPTEVAVFGVVDEAPLRQALSLEPVSDWSAARGGPPSRGDETAQWGPPTDERSPRRPADEPALLPVPEPVAETASEQAAADPDATRHWDLPAHERERPAAPAPEEVAQWEPRPMPDAPEQTDPCPSCHAPVERSRFFCPHCGHRVR